SVVAGAVEVVVFSPLSPTEAQPLLSIGAGVACWSAAGASVALGGTPMSTPFGRNASATTWLSRSLTSEASPCSTLQLTDQVTVPFLPASGDPAGHLSPSDQDRFDG